MNFDELKNEVSTTFGKQWKINKSAKIFSAMLFILFFGASFSAYGQNVYVVDRSDDNNVSTCDNFANNDCTLRGAIQRANTDGNTSQIQLAIPTSSPQTIIIAFGSLTIANDQSLLITSDSLIVPSNGRVTIDGGTSLRPFSVNQGANITFSNLLIQKGGFSAANDGAAIDNNGGTVTIDRCLFLNNVSTDDAGAVKNAVSATMTITNTEFQSNSAMVRGGAIFNEGTMTISNSLFRGNFAGTDGGGISNRGILTVNNSTFSGNTAKRYSGAIDAEAGTINLNSVTIANNIADSDNDGSGAGGGISVNNVGSPVVNVVNTIIAKNTVNNGLAPDFQNTLTSQGYNLIGNTNSTTIAGTTTGNQLNVDPLILPLANNGGTTFTHALAATSPAIDKGRSSGLTTDQRGAGFTRPVDLPNIPNATGGNGADIGAFELQTEPPNITINDVSMNEGNSGTTSFNFTVTLSAAAAQNVTVSYATADGTATAGSDYIVVGVTTLTFTPGQTTKTVTVLVNGDTTIESNETFFVNLSNSTNAVISDNQGIGTIVNDDAAASAIAINDVSQNEGNSGTSNFVFTVSLNSTSSQTVTVGYTTSNGTATSGTDYVATGGTLTFAPSEISKTVTVVVNGDTTIEPDETFFVNLFSATNATIADNLGMGTIINDDSAPCTYTLSPTSPQSVGAASSSLTVTVTTQTGCAWTATSNSNFITVTSGASGTGTGTIVIAISANTGAARSGTLIIAGQTYTINQAAGTVSCPSALPIAFGQTVNGSLQTGDCLYTDNSLYDAYTFSGVAGQKIAVSMNSAQFDAYLFLYQGAYPGGTVVAQDNNSGGGTNARIPATGFLTLPATGTYTILANSFAVGETGTYSLTLNRQRASRFDFDGDGKADVSVFRPSQGAWFVLLSGAGFSGTSFGLAADLIAPADYDGDGKTDIAVFRPSTGTWYLLQSTAGFTGVAFGAPGDVPAPADFDGDGKADIAVFRPSNGTWYILQSTAGFTGAQFGQTGDVPVAGDYDGDGRADVAVFRPSSGTWFIMQSTAGFTGAAFGLSTDKPVPGDFDGDGKFDIAVFRPSDGVFYLQQSTNGFTGIAFGLSTDLPVPADYDGDGKADVAVFRNGTWYLLQTTSGFTGVAFGATDDRPVPNAYIP